MSDPYRRDDDLAYGQDYSGNRGYNDQYGGQEGQDRGIIGDTFKKFKSKYDQHQGRRPQQQDFGYGNNPSSSTVGSQSGGGSGYAGGPYNQQASQYGQPGQLAYPGAPPPQAPQQKPSGADKLLGGLIGSVTSIGDDVQKLFGSSHGQRPPQGQYGYQPGLQSNLQTQTPAVSGPTQHRYDSTFAGPKSGNDVKWYVDGCSYMWAVSQALESARQTIWILDWWLSPELYLRRPPARNEEWRIDKVLQRAANRGVKINIIVYKEVTQALTLSSAHTKHALEALSPNIGVFRHPDHLPDAQTAHSSIISALQGMKLDAAGAAKLGADALKGLYGITDDVILYWAHHEKLCLIDGQIAFMGGLDLCFGRWDTNQHPIADAHPSDLNKIVFPGQDFNNARVMDFSEVDHPFQNKLDRAKSSRMGWSDISICLRGPCVGDLIHHFVDRWNFIYDEKYNVRKDTRYARLPDYPDHRKEEGPGKAPISSQGTQSGIPPQGQQPGQYGQSQTTGGYAPPPWQGSTASSTTPGIAGAAVAGSLPGGGQQSFPPPPPGPPPGASGYVPPSSQQSYTQQAPGSQTQQYQATGQQGTIEQSGYQAPANTYQGQTQSIYGAAQQSGYQAPSSNQPGQYSASQTQYPPPTAAGYGQSQVGSTSSIGHSQQQAAPNLPYQPSVTPQPQYQQQAPSQTYPSPAVSQSQHQQTTTSQPYQPSITPQPQSQYSTGPATTYPATPTGQQGAPGQYGSQPSQSYQQRPVTPTGPPVTQLAAQQYTAYTGSSGSEQARPPGSQGPTELGTNQYQPYGGQPTARGFDTSQEYDQGYSGQRGFGDDSYGHEYGDERAFGRKPRPDASPGRFDRYKEEARKFQQEGKILGHDVSKYGDKLEARIDGTLSQFTGGRVGRPQSAGGGMSCQLVRSCTKWSNGTNTEKSVQNAYIDLIQNSRHFIYIENQFFITATGDNQKPVKNMIGKALVERIVRAARERTPFKIIVNIPSVPAFAGDLVDDSSLGTRAIMEFQYNSICRGGYSIMEEVKKAGVEPMNYIRFYNLRNYDRINVTPAMQQAQQQSGLSYDDARRQYESQLGSGYGGYGEIAAPIPGPGQQPSYGTQQYGAPSQQPQGGQYGQPPQSAQATAPYGATTQQAQTPGQYGAQGQQPQGQSQYGATGQQSYPQPGQYGSTRGPDQPYGQQPGQYGQANQPQSYGAQQQQVPQFPPPPQAQTQQQGYGAQQIPQAYNQYQQAVHSAPEYKADDWDTVSSCYMLGGQDIRSVPWSGPPEAELDAFVSEELYIHSKVMIVDDQTVVCGSANLNDRSMLGSHDSEIALIINDNTPVESSMAGRPWRANRFAASLRRQLFRKHLGLIRPQDMQRPDDNFHPVGVPNAYDWGSPEDHIVSDPLSDAFQSLWNSRARTNTEVYRKAFRAVPDDNVHSWPEYKEFFEYYFAKAEAQAAGKDQKAKVSRVEYGHVVRSDFPGGVKELKELLSQVRGTLVEMPLCFLQSKFNSNDIQTILINSR